MLDIKEMKVIFGRNAELKGQKTTEVDKTNLFSAYSIIMNALIFLRCLL